MRALLAAVALAVTCAAGGEALSLFSAAAPGKALPPGWRLVTLPGVKPATIELVDEFGTTVLQVASRGSAGTAAHALDLDSATRPRLVWHWKIGNVVAHADLTRREGDDFAARVYVFFDVPAAELPWKERVKLELARLVHGKDVPAAGLCYVWDNKHARGTIAPNPYAPYIRTFVLESGEGSAGRWVEERRDLAADFRAAFPERAAPVPRITGIAVGNDTDQTQDHAVAWFGDFWLEPGR